MKKRKISKAFGKKQSAPRKVSKKVVPVSLDPGSEKTFPIVGIGASAGGLEAIEGFLAGLPAGLNIAFIVIQHLAPEHKSMMSQLLKKYTALKVMEIQDGMKVNPGCMYLNLPNKDVSIINGKLYLLEPTVSHGLRLPIDYFFHSLAQSVDDKAICIILSGTGTDGTLGLKAIKEAGGMAMAQQESQARYDSMPRSAIDTGLVDYTLPVEKMASELIKYVKHPYIGQHRKPLAAKENLENHFQKILMVLRLGTGHDLSHYKRNTMFRRIQRRMAIHQINNISEYVRYLQENPAEVKMLFKDMLITVTNFFRDPKAFHTLDEKVILPLIEKSSDGANIRVWVVGCSTGEEASSIAILFSETMHTLKKHLNIQIFATDMDADAIEYARRGVYPESIAANVSEKRLETFFIKKDKAYAIKKQIRDMVVFATQDIIKDAPFSKLDLVCCRNVLIYMDVVLQKKLLPLFHYTLKPSGCLFLGTSETIGDFADRFVPVDIKWKIFRRKGTAVDRTLEYPITRLYDITAALPAQMVEPSVVNVRQITERTILQNYAPPSVLIDDKFDILYFHGNTEPYLTLPQGEPSFNILKVAREELRHKLTTLLQEAETEKGTVVANRLKIRQNNEIITLNLILRPLPGKEKFMMVMFENVTEKAKAGLKKKEAENKAADPRITALEQELRSTKEYLQTTIEELETTNEELRSTNEELQSTNEELQSTNEELETSREELQSTNEELTTLNTEMQSKLEELSSINDDMSNILSGAMVGTLLLDSNRNIKRFTPSMKRLFKLIDSDVGRPINDIVHTLKYESLSEDINNVMLNLGCVEKEIETISNTWAFVRITPYRTSENLIDGTLLTFFDITALKTAINARDFAEGVVETIREPLVMLDEKLRVISANKSFYKKFLVKPAETENELIYEIGDRQWDIPILKKLLENILQKKSVFENFKVKHNFTRIGQRVMLLNARQIFHGKVGTRVILLAIEDITDRTA